MNTTLDYVDAIKAKTGAASDYAVAKILDVKTQTISVWRNGKGGMSDETALKVASILDIEPFIVLAAVHAERAKTAPEKAAWESMFKRLGGMAAAVVLGVSISAPPPANAATARTSSQTVPDTVYYVKSRRRKNTPLGMLLLNLISPPKFAG